MIVATNRAEETDTTGLKTDVICTVVRVVTTIQMLVIRATAKAEVQAQIIRAEM